MRWKYAGTLDSRLTPGKILSETRDLDSRPGKHCAPRYYCTGSNGRDIETLEEREGGRGRG